MFRLWDTAGPVRTSGAKLMSRCSSLHIEVLQSHNWKNLLYVHIPIEERWTVVYYCGGVIFMYNSQTVGLEGIVHEHNRHSMDVWLNIVCRGNPTGVVGTCMRDASPSVKVQEMETLSLGKEMIATGSFWQLWRIRLMGIKIILNYELENEF